MSKNSGSSSGLGLGSVLTIIFVVLKLVGVIDWKWVWVLCPLWISALITLLIIVAYIAYIVHDAKQEDLWLPRRERKSDKWKF